MLDIRLRENLGRIVFGQHQRLRPIVERGEVFRYNCESEIPVDVVASSDVPDINRDIVNANVAYLDLVQETVNNGECPVAADAPSFASACNFLHPEGLGGTL